MEIRPCTQCEKYKDCIKEIYWAESPQTVEVRIRDLFIYGYDCFREPREL